MKAPVAILFLLIACLLIHAPGSAFALTTWPFNGLPVCTASGVQNPTDCIPDGTDGAFIAWSDPRNGQTDIYMQRVNALGVALWQSDGVAACSAAGNQLYPRLAPDGTGGVIVTWYDDRNATYDIYAQRLTAAGVPMWTSGGVVVCTNPFHQSQQEIVSDGVGGAIIVWADFNGPANLYAQRVDPSGNLLWPAAGVPVCTAANDQVNASLVMDGKGGAIVMWRDARTGHAEVYGQRLNDLGAVLWASNGLLISDGVNPNDVWEISMAADGAGGAVVAWWQVSNIYGVDKTTVQRVDKLGQRLWGTGGVPACVGLASETEPALVADGSGGAIVTWTDYRDALNPGLYAQRLNASGVVIWDGTGIPVCVAPRKPNLASIASDGSGGVVAVWQDEQSGTNMNIYAQRINNYGLARWTANGVPVCTAGANQVSPMAVSDGAGSVIAVWRDARGGGSAVDIYAQRVDGRFGYWGYPEPVLASVNDVPGDQGGKVRVNWVPSGREIIDDQVISHYTVWRAVGAAAAQAATDAGVPTVELANVGEKFTGPAIRIEKAGGVLAFWELVGTQDAIYLEGYSLTVPTGYDSTASNPAVHDFQVVAHAYNSQYTNWPSNVVSGHSVDNLAPAAPLYLTANRIGNDVNLKWNRVRVPDLKNYAVYRGTSSGVTPIPGNFLASANDSILVDTNAPSATLYYVVTAIDVHANQSAPSNEALVSGVTGVGNTPAITQLTVLQNFPNPFNAGTEFQIGLPAPSDITVEVYDVAGRRVGSSLVRGAAAGWQRLPFAGRDERGAVLASGVYFYRITANGTTVTRKMVIAR